MNAMNSFAIFVFFGGDLRFVIQVKSFFLHDLYNKYIKYNTIMDTVVGVCYEGGGEFFCFFNFFFFGPILRMSCFFVLC